MRPRLQARSACRCGVSRSSAAILVAGLALGVLLGACSPLGGQAQVAASPPAAETPAPVATPDPTPSNTPALPTPTATLQPTLTPLVVIVTVLVTPEPSPTPTANPAPPTPTPAASPTPGGNLGTVGRVVVTREVDSRQRPVGQEDSFNAGDTVYVSVEFVGVRSGATLGIRWILDDGEMFVFETPPKDAFSRGYFAFFIDKVKPGDYKAEVLISGEKVAEAAFKVILG